VTVDHCLYVGISLLGFLRSHILVPSICHIAILAILCKCHIICKIYGPSLADRTLTKPTAAQINAIHADLYDNIKED
jgi:hypothetical protein